MYDVSEKIPRMLLLLSCVKEVYTVVRGRAVTVATSSERFATLKHKVRVLQQRTGRSAPVFFRGREDPGHRVCSLCLPTRKSWTAPESLAGLLAERSACREFRMGRTSVRGRFRLCGQNPRCRLNSPAFRPPRRRNGPLVIAPPCLWLSYLSTHLGTSPRPGTAVPRCLHHRQLVTVGRCLRSSSSGSAVRLDPGVLPDVPDRTPPHQQKCFVHLTSQRFYVKILSFRSSRRPTRSLTSGAPDWRGLFHWEKFCRPRVDLYKRCLAVGSSLNCPRMDSVHPGVRYASASRHSLVEW